MYAVDVIKGLLEPWVFLFLSATYAPSTVLRLVRESDWAALTSFSKFSYVWFANFWSYAGPMVRAGAEARVVPLLQGRIRSGMAVPAEGAIYPGVEGTVVEIGAGSGMWVSIFSDKYISEGVSDRKGLGERRRVTKAFGIEPNADHHPALQRRINEAGLGGRYQIVPVGIEDIGRTGLIQKGSVDSIVTVLCLCSIPDQEKNIRELYTYLKPGGRWYVYEHVQTMQKQGGFMRYYQSEISVL